MYEYPFGAGQQLNLNWIISEIISIHKALDPDYVVPVFDNTFPFTNLNVLNLDWILKELREIKDIAPSEDAKLLKMVANALIAASYDENTSYEINDIVFDPNTSRLYICTTPTTGVWNAADWEIGYIGDIITDIYKNLDWFNEIAIPFDGLTNMFDPAQVTSDSFINSSGEIVARSGLSVTDYIPTVPFARVDMSESLGSNTYYYAFYTKNKELVSVGALNNSNNYIYTPENAFYFRTTVNNNGIPYEEIYVITPDKLNTNYLSKMYIQPAGKTFGGKPYLAFPDVINFNNKKVIALRAANTHTSQDGDILIFENVNGKVSLKKTITAAMFNSTEDLRDPSMIVINKGKNILLSLFASVDGVTTHNSYAAILDENYNIVEYATILSNATVVLWGKPLITPTNHLLFSAYGVNGGIYAIRSNEVFTETTLAGLTYTPTTISSTSTLNEMSFEYVGNYLVAVARRTSSSAMLSRTLNLEGNSGWTTPASLQQVIHAPRFITIKSNKYVVVCGAYRSTGGTSDRQPCVYLIDVESPATVNFKLLSNDVTYASYCGVAKVNDFTIDFVTYEDVNYSVTTKLINYRVNLLEALPELNKIIGYDNNQVSYPISIDKGGTGATTAAQAKQNLGITDPYYPIAIVDGGTGATTALEAKQNLGLGDLNSNKFQVDASTTTTLTLPNSARGMLFIIGSVPDIISISVSGSGAVSYASLLTPTGFTYSTATNQFTIDNSITANFICGWLDFNNKVYSKQT